MKNKNNTSVHPKCEHVEVYEKKFGAKNGQNSNNIKEKRS